MLPTFPFLADLDIMVSKRTKIDFVATSSKTIENDEHRSFIVGAEFVERRFIEVSGPWRKTGINVKHEIASSGHYEIDSIASRMGHKILSAMTDCELVVSSM